MTGVPMPEPKSRRGPAIAAFIVATLFALAAGLGAVAAAVCGWLAQPACALAVRWWRGTGAAPSRGASGRDAGELLLLWGAAALVGRLLAAWLLPVLLEARRQARVSRLS